MRTLLSLLLVPAAAVLLLTGSRAPRSDARLEPVHWLRTFALDRVGVSRPLGLAYAPSEGALLVVHAGGGSTQASGAEVVSISPFADLLDTRPTSLDVSDPDALFYDAGATASTAAAEHGWIAPSLDEPFAVADPLLLPAGLEDARGVAFHPTTGHLHVLTSDQRLHELDTTGAYLGVRDASALGLRDPRGLVFAPSADTTDDPSRLSLYVGDSRDGDKTKKGGSGDLAVVVEASLSAPASLPVSVPTFAPIVANVIEASRFSPPSPDTAGLAYRPDLHRLVVTDSEVNETTLFQNVNVWLTTVRGTVVDTGVTSNFMEPGHEEPTGIAYDPSRGHYFVSDDSAKRIWEVDPGPDGDIGTADDTVTSIDTEEFGSSDPEGVAFDTLRGHLYVCDGINDEVYRILPGSNGVFDGVPPEGDDVLLQFDSEILGIHDPEGIEHNPDDDTLFISGSDMVAETTLDGVLLRLIDLGGLGIEKPAGLAYAPGSENAGFMHLYVADRGEDNDSNRSENDGKIFELTLVDEPGVLDIRVSASRDDAEEAVLSGEVKLNGGDLELGFDDEDQQTVGIRFVGLEILRRTPILESWVQFTAEDESNVSTDLTIRGQRSGNAPTFGSSDYDVSSRPRTQASVAWSPQPWNTEGDAGGAQRTPDLSSIVQEIVDLPGWNAGNALVLVIDGTGWRVAESYDGTRDAAPLLHVRFPPPDCGNGDHEIGEQCDGSDFDGVDCSDRGCSGGSLACTSLCRFDTSSCTGCPVCGNDVVEFGEECDDGNAATEECAYQETSCQVCDADCNLVPGATSLCGDGIVDPANGEECDDADLDDTDACTHACRLAVCGDGFVQTGVEACDDGNGSNEDACLDTCELAFCGDGFVRPGFEECDDANLDNDDACLDSCLTASCGDGFVQLGVEACDDANLDDGDACLTSCEAASCGDGFVWAGLEECDDGNADNTDGCLDVCLTAFCGDGFVRAGVEACDDGNASNDDGCLTSCEVASCGDGFVQLGVEACDDGNADNTDACLDTCSAASCGDGYVWAPVEECDDGNADNTDGCLDTCFVPEPSEALLLLSALATLSAVRGRSPPREAPRDVRPTSDAGSR